MHIVNSSKEPNFGYCKYYLTFDTKYIKTTRFQFYLTEDPRLNEEIVELCKKIFEAIGNRDLTAVSALVQNPNMNTDIPVRAQMFTLVNYNDKVILLTPLKAAALLGFPKIVQVLLTKTALSTLGNYLKDLHFYDPECDRRVLQHIKSSSEEEMLESSLVVDDAYTSIQRKADSEAKTKRLQELEEIRQSLSPQIKSKMAIVAVFVNVAALQNIIQEYLFGTDKPKKS